MKNRSALKSLTASAVAAALLIAAGGPAAAQEGPAQEGVVVDGSGDAVVTLHSARTPTMAPGTTGWIQLMWSVAGADAREFRVNATMPDGTPLGVPENTADHSSLYWDDQLSTSEMDYTALKITIPKDQQESFEIDITLSYLSDTGTHSETHTRVIDVDGGEAATTTTATSTTATSTTAPSTTAAPTTAPSTTAAPSTVPPATAAPSTTADRGPVVLIDTQLDSRGWITNPFGTDGATTGQWAAGQPNSTSWSGIPLQLGSTPSEEDGFFTGLEASSSDAGRYDVDGGVTGLMSPEVELKGGTSQLTLQWYFAYLDNASSQDFMRIAVIGEDGNVIKMVVNASAAVVDHGAAWSTTTVAIDGHEGEKVRIFIQAADFGDPSLIEAGVADVLLVTNIS